MEQDTYAIDIANVGMRYVTVPKGSTPAQVRAAAAPLLRQHGYTNPNAHAVVTEGGFTPPPPPPPVSNEEYWREKLGDQGSISAVDPLDTSVRDTLGNFAYETGKLIGHSYPNRLRSELQSAIDFIPGLGDIAGVEDTAGAFKRGDIGSGLGHAVATALGAFPGLGDAAAGVSKAMLLGAGAKYADRSALNAAERMAEAGAKPEAIRQATGWFRGGDHKWRFEIDDSPMEFRNPTAETVGRAIYHPELFANYPDMGKMRFGREEGTGATYMLQPWRDPPETLLLGESVRGDPRSTLGHELQHGLQTREGFTLGSDPVVAPRVYDGPDVAVADRNIHLLEEQLAKLRGGWFFTNRTTKSNLERSLQHWLDKRQQAAGFEGYQRIGGEVEARNVQTRLDYTPAQRAATPPWATADRTPEQQIHPAWPEWLDDYLSSLSGLTLERPLRSLP